MATYCGVVGLPVIAQVELITKEGIAISHLIHTRRAGQSIVVNLALGADPDQALQQLLRGGVTVGINRVENGSVRVLIDALRTIQILRDELTHPSAEGRNWPKVGA